MSFSTAKFNVKGFDLDWKSLDFDTDTLIPYLIGQGLAEEPDKIYNLYQGHGEESFIHEITVVYTEELSRLQWDFEVYVAWHHASDPTAFEVVAEVYRLAGESIRSIIH